MASPAEPSTGWAETTPCPREGIPSELLVSLVKLLRDQVEGQGLCTAHLEDAYLASVINVPGRTFAYARDRKIVRALEWHTEVGRVEAAHVEHLVRSGSMYWHGRDRTGRPILWVRPGLKDWARLNVESEVRYHVHMLERGLRRMPAGVTTFAVVASTAGFGLRHVNLKLMRSLLALATTAYPDRLGLLAVAPVNWAVSTLHRVLRPLIPARVADKLMLMRQPHVELAGVMDGSLIPDYLGGQHAHPASIDAEGRACVSSCETQLPGSADQGGAKDASGRTLGLLELRGCLDAEQEATPSGSPQVTPTVVEEDDQVVEVLASASWCCDTADGQVDQGSTAMADRAVGARSTSAASADHGHDDDGNIDVAVMETESESESEP